jgi:hypothetical protein
MVVIDHNEWRHKSVVNRLIGSIFTKFNLFNLNAAFVNFKIKDFPENVRNDYNTTYKLIESKANNQALIPYLSLPLYNVNMQTRRSTKITIRSNSNFLGICRKTVLTRKLYRVQIMFNKARSKGTKKIFLSDFYQVTFEFEYENKIKQYHVV